MRLLLEGYMPANRAISEGKPMRENLSYRLSIIHALLGRRTAFIYTSRQLTSHQWKVLSVLYSWPPMPAARITELVTLDKAAISRAVTDLIKRGLADRKLLPESGVINVVLTPAGGDMYRAMMREMHDVQKEIFGGLKDRERTVLFDAFDKLETALRASSASSPAMQKKARAAGSSSGTSRR
jgi:DNA-binding MarR family transcriptional regulator